MIKIDEVSTCREMILPLSANPVTSYTDALARFESLLLDAQKEILPACQSKLLTHGEQTEHVVVLFHGFSNCPEQFSELGRRLFEQGYNVFIPRQPYHGLSNRLSKELQNLKAEKLIAYGELAVDIAHGLAACRISQ